MKYVLMQAPKKEDDYSAQIVIVDNSNAFGRKKVEKLAADGYTFAGTIESDLRVHQMQSGFAWDARKQIDAMRSLFLQIREMAESHVELIL